MRQMLLASGLLLLSVGGSAVAAQERPNIILVLADNLGYGELGTYGGGIIRGAPTPRIDSIAREGMKLTNFNAENWCVPNRAALLTGRYPIRSGAYYHSRERNVGPVQWEITLAELLHEAGYVSAYIGKWHLGNRDGRFPTAQGFDEWYGIPRSSDEALYMSSDFRILDVVPPTYTLEGRKGEKTRQLVPYDVDMRSRMDAEITRRTIDFIQREVKRKTPFFAQVSLTTFHPPDLPSPEWKGKTGNGRWADILAQLDYHVGQLLDAVDKAGIRDNTIFMFVSDNGPTSEGSPGPWRGRLPTVMEGSLRTPFLIRWPGKIPADSESNEIFHVVDIFPTIARIAGVKVPTDRAIDGVDQLDFMTGKQKKSNRDFFPIYKYATVSTDPNEQTLTAVKFRNWKVYFYRQLHPSDPPTPAFTVINLLTDPWEEGLTGERKPDDSGYWALWLREAIRDRIAEFKASLEEYPIIKPLTPDPYVPPQR